jgi:hypothetical protein
MHALALDLGSTGREHCSSGSGSLQCSDGSLALVRAFEPLNAVLVLGPTTADWLEHCPACASTKYEDTKLQSNSTR